MPYTERSRTNLLREGIAGQRIHVTGNPILEVIEHYGEQIQSSDVLSRLCLDKDDYFLVTMHRAENVDLEHRLRSLIRGFELLQQEYRKPVIISTHPRTASVMERFRVDASASDQIRFHEPFGLFDFVALEQNAFCVLSDSGTVQEECAIFGVANVTVRDVTERPETLECGSNMLSGADSESIVRCVRTVLDEKANWIAPAEYMVRGVSATVVRLLLGYRSMV
jgi:UDP-N-acetylglucosamine 2-epimerase (non-hydrolysing)